MSDYIQPNNSHKKTSRYALTGWGGSLLLHGSFAAALFSVAVNMPPTPAVSAVEVSTQETAKQREEKKKREEALKQAKQEDQSRRSTIENSVAKLEEVKRELEQIREQRLRELEQKTSSPNASATPQSEQTPQPQATPDNSPSVENKNSTAEELKKLQDEQKAPATPQPETKGSDSQKPASEEQSTKPQQQQDEKLAALPKDQQLRQNARIAPQRDASTQDASTQDASTQDVKEGDEKAATSQREDSNNSKADVAKLLDEAAKTEKEIAELDRQIRAAELAKSQNLPMDEALSQTETVLAQRPPLDRSLLQESAVGNNEARAEQNAAKSQISSMVASGQRALSRAKRADGEENSAAGQQSNNSDTQGKSAEQGTSGEPSTRNGEGAPVGTGIEINPQLDAQMMPLAQQDGQTAKDLTEATKSGGEPFSGSGSDTKLPNSPSGKRTDTTTVRQVIPEISNDIAKEAVAGRRVGPGSSSAKWMYADSWYVVGPFDNSERKNLHRSFAPETALDLDAAYTGKGGRIVQWKFQQSPEPMITPDNAEEYAIYYAYTNLWFDEPRDLWIALGSDDHSQLWLNGTLVWKSDDSLKGWQAGEGLRRVHFKKGLNRVLVRLENGWQGTAFSLLISLQEDPQA